MATTTAVPDLDPRTGAPPRRAGGDLLEGDRPLRDALVREGAGELLAEVHAAGRTFAAGDAIDDGTIANVATPQIVGPAEVRFDPAFHAIMRRAVEHGITGVPWADERPGAHVARAAKFMLLAQVEAGSTCPMAMTYSCVPALRLSDAVAAEWEPRVSSGVYDPRELPAEAKDGALIGMALTEAAGGSDLAGLTTVGRPLGGDAYAVSGVKWFVSAIQSDAFFVLAKTETGISCLLVPRLRDDGTPNGFEITALKDKLGNRSNPTAEVTLTDAHGRLVGEEGRGVAAIMAMIGGTRTDCVLGSTAVMRLGTAEAIHHGDHRHAFGRALSEQPVMTAVLADLALETEAAVAAALWLVRLAERSRAGDEGAELVRRIAAPALKYWICKRAPIHAAEAIECQGGFGYMEDSRLARCYREAPLMSIWEGSGNVQTLDVLRAVQRTPAVLEALLAELDAAAGGDRRLDARTAELRALVADPQRLAADPRGLAARIALALQAAVLVRGAPFEVADAFCASRLADGPPAVFGALPASVDAAAVVARHRPQDG
ncbi:Acyl-CoA dehydrogenase [Patulibacter medicamentivorans]|uniref:Acyl-CoA dehydrogenase n=1 Tax=Patulibacter medicamentivorans TaxID=1097667 RepID=H0E2P9_9ACTN|nr:acyl-CoA dehydrogenase family protein [Patulibacter medicamentivorans]EHN12063.1 Acyl-CoA dehydrogenase [Patulibacter medicamentivorans]